MIVSAWLEVRGRFGRVTIFKFDGDKRLEERCPVKLSTLTFTVDCWRTGRMQTYV
jgi:hypothetical protein